MLRTRVGYAGGSKPSPTYHELGDHTETFELDFDPSVIAYRDLVALWAEDFSPGSWSKQYRHLLLYRDEEQKRVALEVAPRRAHEAIIPLPKFWRAENYHQKYYLRHTEPLFRELKGETDSSLADSSLAARLNGFAGGYGDAALLEEELASYRLSPEGERALRSLVSRRR